MEIGKIIETRYEIKDDLNSNTKTNLYNASLDLLTKNFFYKSSYCIQCSLWLGKGKLESREFRCKSCNKLNEFFRLDANMYESERIHWWFFKPYYSYFPRFWENRLNSSDLMPIVFAITPVQSVFVCPVETTRAFVYWL